MLHKVKRPCEHCPFRKDQPGFLHPARAQEIADDLRDDSHWFACHETVYVYGKRKGRRRTVPRSEQSQCAGSMVVLDQERRPNIAMRLAVYWKLVDLELLRQSRPLCFSSLAEFVAHHTEARG